jgi:hypothetical protein
MFSWKDVQNTLSLYNNANDARKSLVSMIIVCPNDKVYSIKIDDPTILQQKINSDWNNVKYQNVSDKDKVDRLNQTIQLKYSKDSDLERVFLQSFGSYGISLYKANSTLTNWSKQTLNITNPNAPFVVSTPCN